MRIVHPSMTRRDVLRSAVAATLTERPSQFLRYETVSLAGPRAVTYRLRHRRASVVIRHGTRDIDRLISTYARSHIALPEVVRTAVPAGRPLRMLDLGAGTGIAASALLEVFPDAELTSVEPDPMNLIILRRTIRANPHVRGWNEVVGATGDGTYLRGSGYGRFASRDSDDERLSRTTPIDPFPLLAHAAVARLNIQGAEWQLLADPRFWELRPPVVVLECHERGCPRSDPVGHGARLLSSAGYRLMRGTRLNESVLYAWRPS